MEYYSTVRKNQICREMDGIRKIILSEVTQAKDKYYVLSYTWMLAFKLSIWVL